MKRISIVLVICMLMSMIPTMAFADTETAVAEEMTVTEETATDVAVTGNIINVSWDKVANAKGYLVYRKSGSGSWKKVATINSGSTLSYKNKSVKAGAYQYAVKAYGKYNGKTIYSSLAEPAKTRTLKTTSVKLIDSGEDMTNKLSWYNVSGTTGYEVYYKRGESGSWTKIATVGKVTTYKTGTVPHGVYCYYKVRPIYRNGSYVSKGAFSNTDNTMWYYEPNIDTFMSDDWDSDCNAVAMILTNNGVGKVRVYSAGAKLIDSDTDMFDRKVRLYNVYDDDVYYRSYIDIAADSSDVFGWSVIGDSTWYDEETEIKFKIRYDGVYYWCYASRYYGFNYYKIED